MNRPEYITKELIARFDEALEKDTITPEFFKTTPLLREVLYSGFYLSEKLEELGAEDHIIVKMQFSLGAKAFGSDPWKEAETMLEAYKKGEVSFIDEEAVEAEIKEATEKDVPRDEKTQN